MCSVGLTGLLGGVAPAKGNTAMYEIIGVVSLSLAGGNKNKNSCRCKTLKDAAKADGGIHHLAKYEITGFFVLNNTQVG